MKLIPRHRHSREAKRPRVEITQAEITADLQYPAPARPQHGPVGRRGAR